jgi:hypothetical protein
MHLKNVFSVQGQSQERQFRNIYSSRIHALAHCVRRSLASAILNNRRLFGASRGRRANHSALSTELHREKVALERITCADIDHKSKLIDDRALCCPTSSPICRLDLTVRRHASPTLTASMLLFPAYMRNSDSLRFSAHLFRSHHPWAGCRMCLGSFVRPHGDSNRSHRRSRLAIPGATRTSMPV